MNNKNDEIHVLMQWKDELGNDTYKDRLLFSTIEEAEKFCVERKKFNGSYVDCRIQIKEKGTFEKIQKIQKQIEILEEELDKLM